MKFRFHHWAIGTLFFAIAGYFGSDATGQQPPHSASGIKIGETTSDSAIVWVRLTRKPEADFSKIAALAEQVKANKPSAEMPVDAVPGIAGQARIHYWPDGNPGGARASDWVAIDEQTDFTHQFQLAGLSPGQSWKIEIEARLPNQSESYSRFAGQFRTAPQADQSVPVRFVISTCQAVRSIDAGTDGHRAYRQIRDLDPDFFVHTGDIVYYDRAPFCKSAATARAKWNLMFAYRYNHDFFANVSSYFMKDDHDTLKDDCWPGQRYGELTFDEGLVIFREQVPMGERTWRTVRWGRDVQIWLTEHRDFRSDNRMPDGPDKTILGAEQKRWLKESIAASDATFRFVIAPGPIVGPDKPGKADNHSNAVFAHEGQELRDFLARQNNVYVIAGDRHWQYCSRDPDTGLLEMGCGPINDEHHFGGNVGYDADYHRYFAPRGGFLMVTVNGDQAQAEWYHASDPQWQPGQPPAVLYTESLPVE